MEKINQINIVIKLLKQGEILYSKIDNKTTFFAYKNKSILCLNSSFSIHINEDEFSELYQNTSFYIYENNDQFVDLKKDEEYYSMKYNKK